MERRRILQKQDDIILPPGYRRVEYIEGTGTQAINGYYFSVLTPYRGEEFCIRYSIDRFVGRFFVCPEGIFCDNTSRMYWKWDSWSNVKAMPFRMDGNIHEYKIIHGVYYDDDNLVIDTGKSEDGWTNLQLLMKNGQTVFFAAKIYEIYLKNEGEYISRLIPCVRESDGKAGLYDIVKKGFVYNNMNNTNFVTP